MESKIENREWKEQRIKKERKRAVVSIIANTIIAFAFGALAFLFNTGWFLFSGICSTILMVVLNIQNAKALQNLAQMTMVYKLTDESFHNEWNDYVTAVDYRLNREYHKKHKESL